MAKEKKLIIEIPDIEYINLLEKRIIEIGNRVITLEELNKFYTERIEVIETKIKKMKPYKNDDD